MKFLNLLKRIRKAEKEKKIKIKEREKSEDTFLYAVINNKSYYSYDNMLFMCKKVNYPVYYYRQYDDSKFIKVYKIKYDNEPAFFALLVSFLPATDKSILIFKNLKVAISIAESIYIEKLNNTHICFYNGKYYELNGKDITINFFKNKIINKFYERVQIYN